MEELLYPNNPVSRLYCRCIETDGVESLDTSFVRTEKCIAELEQLINNLKTGDKKAKLQRALKVVTKTQKEQRGVLAELSKQSKLHSTIYKAQYARSMIDLAKKRSIGVDRSREPLQTSAWKVGDVKRHRENANKKRGRKKKKTKTKATATTVL